LPDKERGAQEENRHTTTNNQQPTVKQRDKRKIKQQEPKTTQERAKNCGNANLHICKRMTNTNKVPDDKECNKR
jgi:hypothetical protein